MELDLLISQGQGFIRMSKPFFFKLFKQAFDQSFTEEAIKHAFAKPGIWPICGDHLIKAATRPKPKKQPSKDPSGLSKHYEL